MEKKYVLNKLSIIFSVFIVLGGLFYYRYYIYPYPWDKAEESFQQYINEQGVDKNNIENIEKMKETKTGGILYRVYYTDDPNLTYEYIYSRDDEIHPYKIFLIVYDSNNDSTEVSGVTPKYQRLKDVN